MMDERLERVEAGVQDLKADLQEVKTDLQEVKTDLQEVKTDLQEVKADVNHLKTEVHVLKADVGKLDGTVHKLTILHEDTREKVQWIAERLDATATREEMSRGFAAMDARFSGLELTMNTFIRAQTDANRAFKEQFGDHEGRLRTLERRRSR